MQTTFLGLILALIVNLSTLSSATNAKTAPLTPLAQLVADRFGTLSLAEERLVNAAASGTTADCRDLLGEERIVRGELLSWLCTDRDASARLTYRGISIVGAEVAKDVDLQWAKISFPIAACKCVFVGEIDLSRSHVGFLTLAGSYVTDLKADTTYFEGCVYLHNGFHAGRGVNFTGAKINGDLICDGGQFTGKGDTPAFNAELAEVKGGVYLRGGKVDGGVNLADAKIDRLDCGGSEFIGNSKTSALNANDIQVKGTAFLNNGFKAEGGVNLVTAKIDGDLVCDGGQFTSDGSTPALNANGAKVKGAVYLRGGKADGGVDLGGAKIDRNLEFDGSEFSSNGSILTLSATCIEVKGGVYLRGGFRANGGVNLVSAKIDGNLECDSSEFSSSGSTSALIANGVEVKGNVFLRTSQFAFRAKGGVHFVAAKIGGDLDCNGAQFSNQGDSPALDAEDVEIKGRVYLGDGFGAEGGVNLAAAKIDQDLGCDGGQFIADGKAPALNLGFAKIGGHLNCTGGQFISNGKAPALDANGCEIKGSAFLMNGFRAAGAVNLVHAKIDGTLDCNGGKFIGSGEMPAFNADSAEVKSSIFLINGFEADGGAELISAKIDGNLDCTGGKFISKGEMPALNANSAEIKGNAFLIEGFKAEAGVNLTGAKIDGTLDCTGGQFIGHAKVPALTANAAKIGGDVLLRNGFKSEGNVIFFGGYVGGSFQWFGVESPKKAILDLRQTKVGTLFNAEKSWPASGGLQVDHFVYDEIGQIEDSASPSAEVLLRWLQLQPRRLFLSQPFEQLAAVFRKMGLEEDARNVMIAKNEEHAHYVRWQPQWLWYGLFGHLIGYGYTSSRAFIISLVVIGIGWWLFRRGYRHGLITPIGDAKYTVEKDGAHPSDDYPKFNAFVYSLETFVPLVKLGLGDHWTPNANRGPILNSKAAHLSTTTGSLLRYYLWFHIIAGWVLTTLWVGGLTGLVKT